MTNLFWINRSTKFYQADYDAMQIYREGDLRNFCFDKSLQPIGVTDERLWQKLRQLVDFLQFQADGFELRIITAVAFTLERPAIKLGPQSKSQESSLVLVRTKFQPKWYPFGLAVAGNSHSKAYYIAFPWVWTSFAKKIPGSILTL